MRQVSVPVTLGSPWFRTVETPGCRATEARFSAGDVLHPHEHDRPIIAVMLRGSFDTAIAGHRFECRPDWAWTEPCEERHANFIGRAGARVLVLQPDPQHAPLYETIGPLVDTVAHVQVPQVSLDARRVLAEMDHNDTLSALSIDALLVGMLVAVSRSSDARRERGSPAWLKRVRDRLHDEFRSPPSVAELATTAGVTPTHLCHAFRQRTGTTIGEYVRQVRAAWAAEQLRSTELSLSVIALSAGYADQSHFTREVRRLLGARPSDYRRQGRRA